MANVYGADVLSSLNRILQYRQESERLKVSESLSMLQMAQEQSNLDRSFGLQEAQLGMGETELAKSVRSKRVQENRLIESQIKIAEESAKPESLELQREKSLQEIEKLTVQTEAARMELFAKKMDEMESVAETNTKDIINNVIGSLELGEALKFSADTSDESTQNTNESLQKTNWFKVAKDKYGRPKAMEVLKEFESAVHGYTATQGVGEHFENMLINYTSARIKIAQGLKDNLTNEEKKYNQIFEGSFKGGGRLERLRSMGIELIRLKQIENNIDLERVEAQKGDYKFDIDKVSNIKMSSQDAELLDAIIRGGEDIDNIPPSYMGSKGMKAIQKSIFVAEKSLDDLTLLHNKAKQSKKPTERQQELIDDFENKKDDILQQIRIQKRVLNRIRSDI
jgi:hypothetical protein